MRIVSWNCQNGISKPEQVSYLMSLRPDIAVIPEMKENNATVLKPDSYVWVTNNKSNIAPKGLGVLTFNGFALEKIPRDEEMEIFLPLRVKSNGFRFNLLAVWNFYSASKSGRFKGVYGDKALEYEAVRYYTDFLNDPALVIGDWNLGPTIFCESYEKILSLLNERGMKCLLKTYQLKNPNFQDTPTYKPVRGTTLHRIDHAMGSIWFQENLKSFEIRPLSEAILSDHAPIVLDFGD